MSARSSSLLCVLAALFLLAALPAAAGAAAPSIGAVWVSSPQPTVIRLNAEVNQGGKASSYHFDYIRKSTYEANVAGGKDPFAGTSRLPSVSDTSIAGIVPTTVSPLLSGLSPETAYRYRVVVKNADGTTTGTARTFATHGTAAFALPDGRGWEMVSPVEKNGGQVDAPETLAGGGVLQAAADGQSVTYGSAASFAGGAQGAAPASQYISARGPGGWSTLNITSPLLSASYGIEDTGVPFQLFSADLARALLLSGRPCRGQEATGCPVANPPLAGTDAPAGYQNYYLRESANGGFTALLGDADVSATDLDPAEFELAFAGASPDLAHVVLSTCAALTAGATEIPLGVGCDPAKANLYLHSAGALTLINSSPGAALAAQSAAVSVDGSRVYFNDTATGNLFLRAGPTVKQIDAAAGGGGTFQVATPDGALAFFTKAGHLYRYDAVAESAADLTPSGGVVGVLGASADGSRAYFKDAAGLKLWHSGTTTTIAPAADASNYPPTTGTARLSADGTRLLFASTVALATSDGETYDNLHATAKIPTSQLYLYDASAATLACVSCNPTFARPLGPSTVPGAIANGQTPVSPHAYKPRALSADGRRVFFDSRDALVPTDVNLNVDVYQWEAQGKGSCPKSGGCVSLISSGLANWGTFVDASATGDDAFFLTDRSLVGADPGTADLYDAKVGGGLPEPVELPACVGDACQVVPPAPEDPVLTTVLAGPGNPAEQYRSYGAKAKKRCPKGKKLRAGKCVKKGKAKRKNGGRR